MNRICSDTFRRMPFPGEQWEDVYALRIRDNKFYFIAMGENAEEYDIVTAARCPECFEVGIDALMLRDSISSAIMGTDMWETAMSTVHNYTSDDDGPLVPSKQSRLLSLVKCYERNGVSKEDDYEILIMSQQEFSNIIDSLRDGDYVFIIREEQSWQKQLRIG